jgi:hypothetical protein
LSTSPSTTTTTERSNASTNRPKIASRTTSLEPNVHVLNPSPTPSATSSALQSQIEPSNTTAIAADIGEQQQTSRKFNPFFTLIQDVDIETTSGEGSRGNDKGTTIHPRNVHYIFCDDDGNEVLESTLLRLSQARTTLELQRGHEEEEEEESTQRSSSDSSATFRKTPSSKRQPPEEGDIDAGVKDEREERVIILDVNEDLSKVEKISSLSPNWQVLNASLEKAPSFDAEGTTPTSSNNEDRGIMLKISGVSISALQSQSESAQVEKMMQGSGSGSGSGSRMRGSRKGIGEGNGMGEEEMQALMEDFDRKMAVLRGIVGNGGGVAEERGGGEREEEEGFDVQ